MAGRYQQWASPAASPEQSGRSLALSARCTALHSPREADERFTREPPIEQGFVSRAFKPLEGGGVRTSIFTLVSTAVGGGVLAIPSMFRSVGFLGGCFLLMLGAFCASETSYILMVAARRLSCPTYAALMAQVFGPHSAVLLDLIIAVYGLGAVLSYLIILGDFVPASAAFLGWSVPRTPAILGVAALALPLALPRSIAALRYVSPWATCSLTLTALVAVIHTVRDGVAPAAHHDVITMDVDIFNAFGISTFAYMAHLNVVPVGVEMNNPSDRRVRKVTTRVGAMLVVFYCITGLAGYTSFGDQTASNFINNYSPGDALAFTVRVALASAIFFGVPINLSPTARSAANVCRYVAATSDERLRLLRGELGTPARSLRWLCVIALLFMAALLASFSSNLGAVVGLLGATLGTFLLAVVPLCVYVSLMHPNTLAEIPDADQRRLPLQTRVMSTDSVTGLAVPPQKESAWRRPLIIAVLTAVSVINLVGSVITVAHMVKA